MSGGEHEQGRGGKKGLEGENQHPCLMIPAPAPMFDDPSRQVVLHSPGALFCKHSISNGTLYSRLEEKQANESSENPGLA